MEKIAKQRKKTTSKQFKKNKESHNFNDGNFQEIKSLIYQNLECNKLVIDLIEEHFECCTETNHITSTSTQFNIDKLENNKFSSIINLTKVNDIRYINKFFESVNAKLPFSGLYFGKVVTHPNRRNYILKKYPLVLNWLIYLFDIIFVRIFPKLFLTKRLYFYLTKGKGRVLSRAEVYGRLYSCGFEIVDEISTNDMLYFVVKKIKEPEFDNNPTYGPLISLKRVGKDGDLFKVYKLRTMHPYSEYLQEYVYNKNKLREGGKIKNDFRVSPEGRVLRKFWIDEIPMIFNILKGDMKLVGVRPLSKHFFSLYPADLQKLRTSVKPGFIPPFYADNPKTLEEIMESERRYLVAHSKNPFQTDLRYLVRSLNNVFFNGLRSF